MRVVILGGGGFRTPLLVRALRRAGLPDLDLVLCDTSPERLEVVAAVVGDVELATDPATALAGADLAFSAVRPGGTAERVHDERAALDRGVLGQETTGPAGLAFALRTLPTCLAHARLLPADAPLLSMTNPAGTVTEALHPVLGARVVGVCDSPSGLIRRAARALDLPPAAVVPDYLGLNHLGWLRALEVDGVDHLPRLLADPSLLARTEEGRLFDPAFLQRLGALPNEYLWYWYRTRDAVAGLRAAGRTRGEQIAADQAAFYAAAGADPAHAAQVWTAANHARNASYLAEARGEDEDRDTDDVDAGGYETVAVDLARRWTAAEPAAGPAAGPAAVLDVGAPVAGRPAGSVGETVCDVDAAGAHPRELPPPTPHQLGLMATVKASERAVIEAATATDDATRRAAAYEAFALHPLVGSLTVARDLADDALRRAEPYRV